MKKEMTLSATGNGTTSASERWNIDLKEIKVWAKTPAEWLRKYYSSIFEREIDRCQAAAVTQAQIAFLSALFTSTDVFFLKAGFAVWFAVSVYRCKKLLA